MSREPRKTCPKCEHPFIGWECISGIRLYREVKGGRIYRAKCSVCGIVDVGVPASVLAPTPPGAP